MPAIITAFCQDTTGGVANVNGLFNGTCCMFAHISENVTQHHFFVAATACPTAPSVPIWMSGTLCTPNVGPACYSAPVGTQPYSCGTGNYCAWAWGLTVTPPMVAYGVENNCINCGPFCDYCGKFEHVFYYR
jgi:hypothetical protein